MGWYETSNVWDLLLLLSFVAIILLYIFQFQVNAWWWRRRIPPLDRKVSDWLDRYSTFLSTLTEDKKQILKQRISLFMKLKTFSLMRDKTYELEEDTKALVAHEFQRLMLGRADFLYEEYDNFVLYNHPFPSPENKSLHCLEVYHEDGVVLLAREQLINGFLDPERFNIGLFAAVQTFVASHPRERYPGLKDIDEEEIVQSFNLDLAQIRGLLGLDYVRKLELLIYCFVLYTDTFQTWQPQAYARLQNIFYPGQGG